METITNMVQTATKTVWGDKADRDEPVSGVQGDVAQGEPYDGGNIESNNVKNREAKSDVQSNDVKNKEAKRDVQSSDLENRKAKSDIQSTKDGAKPSPAADHEDASTEQPSRTEDGDREKDPVIGEDGEMELTGPGPKSLATVAKENGGDAGNRQQDVGSASEPSGSGKAIDVDGSDDAQEKGTGEMYVKTTGFAADGGDFDASKPGAGREADRLMEEKGKGRTSLPDGKSTTAQAPHHGGGAATSDQDKDKDKPGIATRVKDKLHMHKS